MREALREARKGVGLTSPNPAVGAVLVHRNRIVSRGHHEQAGLSHAELNCLRKGTDPRSGTLYVTLEPCSTRGRTGPCTDLIISSGIRRIVIGAIDPNPKHSGRGIALLREAGIDVTSGVLATECSHLNQAFNKWIATKRPFVIAKCAMTLDGRLTRRSDESRWLSSPKSRAHAQQLRATIDAIVVGAETIRRDDPHLTVRQRRRHRQPWRVILTKSGRLPRHARVFRDAHKHRTLVYRDESLHKVLADLGRREITAVLLEGGTTILTQALEQNLVDKIQIYIAPILTGGSVLAFAGRGTTSTQGSLRIGDVQYERIGHDICVTGCLKLAWGPGT